MRLQSAFRRFLIGEIMAFYESTFIARQDISSQDADKLADEFTNIVEKSGGKVIKKESWGLLNLAYKINKAKKGHYVMLGIEASGGTVSEIERKYSLNEDIVRSLTIKVEKISNNPSSIMKNSDDEISFSKDMGRI